MIALLWCAACEEDSVDKTAPADVTNFTATAGDGEVVLTWDEPEDSDVSEYSLTYTPSGAIVTLEASETTYTVTDLSNGVEYTFTIKTRDANDNLSDGVSLVAVPQGDDSDVVTTVGDVSITSDDDFDSYNSETTYINGSLIIDATDLTDLSALENLDSISGDFKIQFCESLDNLEGLESLIKVGSLVIWGDTELEDLAELSALTEVTGDVAIMLNDALTSLDGLDNLTTVGGDVYIGTQAWKDPVKEGGNEALGDFCALKTLLSNGGLTGTFYADYNLYNPAAADITAGNCSGEGSTDTPKDVSNLSTVGGDAAITLTWTAPDMDNIDHYLITGTPDDISEEADEDAVSYTLSGLTNGTEYSLTVIVVNTSNESSSGTSITATAGATVVEGNLSLSSQEEVNAVSSLIEKVTGKLQIYGDDITDLSPLANIDSVFGKLQILQTTSLTTLNGLGVEYVGSTFYLDDNAALQNIDGLQIEYIGNDVAILNNPLLTNLDGFSELSTVTGTIYIGTEAWNDTSDPTNSDYAAPNESLTDFCGLSSLFTSGTHGGDYYAANNGANPTKDEIVANCD